MSNSVNRTSMFQKNESNSADLIKNDYRDFYQINWIKKIKSSKNSKTSFREFLNEALDDHPTGKLTKKRIGEILGYKETYIRNTIGQCGRTKNRDLIISICICADLSAESTDFGLKLYGLSRLDRDIGSRDSLICSEISRNSDIDIINKVLINTGYEGLDVNRFKKQKKICSICIQAYKYTGTNRQQNYKGRIN